MFKLVVLSTILAVATARPSYGHYAEVPEVRYGFAAAPFAYAAAAPALAYAPPYAPAYAPAYAGASITKTVHYANTPVVTGYATSVVKPNLGSVATPPFTVTQQHVFAPARSVQTVVPHVTQVEPEVTVQKVAVDVPVHTPVVSEVEVRTPVVHAAPAVAAVSYAAAPAVAAAPVAYASPAVAAAPVAYAAPAVAAAPVAYAAGIHSAPVVAAAPAGVVSSYSTKQSATSSHSSHSSEVEVKSHNVW